MPEHNRENFLQHQINYTNISLISSKIKVIIIGGGRAGFIKAKSFLKNGAVVTVLSKEFSPLFSSFPKENLTFIKDEYKEEYILPYHLVVIVLEDDRVREEIKVHCKKYCKLYLDGTDFKEGMFVVPCQKNTEFINLSLNTKGGSPKTSIYLANKLINIAKDYDEFVDYCSKLRNSLKGSPLKEEILSFINTDDFYFFFEKGSHNIVLKMFYGGDLIETDFSH